MGNLRDMEIYLGLWLRGLMSPRGWQWHWVAGDVLQLTFKKYDSEQILQEALALATVPGTQCRGNTWSSLITPAHTCPLPPLSSAAKLRFKPCHMKVRETQGKPSSFQSTEPTFKVSDCHRIFALQKPFSHRHLCLQ